MRDLDDDLLQKVIDNEYEFIRRYQKKYQQQPEIDIFIVAFLKELQKRRATAREGKGL